MLENIVIKGARENNLQNVNITIPRNKLVVFTGVSGSGKSTLAFDTIFAEGQRRYIESLSSYARQFLGQMSKPDVDSITGLSPSIAIDQKSTSSNPRSIVATVTEIFDYFRLYFAHLGKPICPKCKKAITTQSLDEITGKIMRLDNGSKIMILSPIVVGKKGAFVSEFKSLAKDGFARVLVDGIMRDLDETIELDKNVSHTISLVVDRLVVKPDIIKRLTESVELALKMSGGVVEVQKDDETEVFSTNHACSSCGYSLSEIAPRIFSFNSPFGACEECNGLGFKQVFDESKIVKAPKISLLEGAITVSGWGYDAGMASMFYKAVAAHFDEDVNTPFEKLSKKMKDMVLYGTKGEKIKCNAPWLKNSSGMMAFEGIIPNLKRRYLDTTSEFMKTELAKLMIDIKCVKCNGRRLKESSLHVLVNKLNIMDVSDMSVAKCKEFFSTLQYTDSEKIVAEPILKEINARFDFLINVGLDYLTLSRPSSTLSGGEAQRIRLATQVGSGLTGVLYILDEPSIGLHQRDNERLLKTLMNLRDLGNTVIVVEHDEDTVRHADYIVDIGPYAGVHGGKIVAKGSLEDIIACEKSITGKFLSGKESIDVPEKRRTFEHTLDVFGASQNNLKDIDVSIPLGVMTVITGVSGSGKSSLVNEIIFPFMNNYANKSAHKLGNFKKIVGYERIDKVINIDQTPIGRTPRSNPATYTNVFTNIRELFASTMDAKERGYLQGRFSFNVSGGRCEHCRGAGINKIEMFFLPDVYVPCEVCLGKRYNRETLQVKYKNKNIFDVLDMTIYEANEFFENVPKIRAKLQTLVDVGLGYIKLGQPATELSGGEAQRVKLATELSKRSTGKSLYILDEPTTGLHSYDIKNLIAILNKLVGNGNSVLLIEHNLDVIKCADYIIDLGPNGGDKGGEVVATGTPEEIVAKKKGYTAKYLAPYLR